jgi:hypothetical protein
MEVDRPLLESQRLERSDCKRIKSQDREVDLSSNIQRTSIKMLIALTSPCLSFPRASHHLTRQPIYILPLSGPRDVSRKKKKTLNAHRDRRVHSQRLCQLASWPSSEPLYRKVACKDEHTIIDDKSGMVSSHRIMSRIPIRISRRSEVVTRLTPRIYIHVIFLQGGRGCTARGLGQYSAVIPFTVTCQTTDRHALIELERLD